MNLQAVQWATRARGSVVAMNGVYQVTRLLAAAREPRVQLPDVLALLCTFFEWSDAAIALVDSQRGTQAFAPRPARLNPRMVGLLEAALRHAQTYNLPWIVENEWSDPALRDADWLGGDCSWDLSFVSVPIRSRGRIEGVLGVERIHSPGDQAEFCFDDDVNLMQVIANVVAASGCGLTRAVTPNATQDSGNPADDVTRPAPDGVTRSDSVIGDDPRWRATVSRARAAAKRATTVLLRGESGTGKEVLARLIHDASPRRDRPFVSVNCAALSETMLESELFGHEKGAFTGAVTRRKGRFELADGGTLFLDEIGEISPVFQTRLLRVLQLGEFERVGGMTTLTVNVRVVAATHRNLEQDVRSGRFRADLYYRISVVPLFVPALRDHPSDIPLLAHEFLRRFNSRNGTQLRLHPSALAALIAYPYPGNVRELENSVCRAATFASGAVLHAEDFAWLHADDSNLAGEVEAASAADVERASAGSPPDDGRDRHVDLEARARLIAALERAGWVQAKAARILGLTPRQIAYALRRHGIDIRKF